jgi:hypothetical protein
MNSLAFVLPQFIVLMLSLPLMGRLSIAMKLIALQAAFSVLADLTAYGCVQFWGIKNEFVYNIYMLGEYILILSAIYFSVQDSFVKKALRICLVIFPILAMISYFFVSFLELNHIILVLSFLFLSAFNLLYLILPDVRKTAYPDPMIWVTIGHIIYFLGVTPYFVGREFMINNRPDLADELFSYINIVLATVRYLFIGIGFTILYFTVNKYKLHD